LARVFGCARVVYNDCLRLREESHAAGVKISDTEVRPPQGPSGRAPYVPP
jgi:putative transposase